MTGRWAGEPGSGASASQQFRSPGGSSCLAPLSTPMIRNRNPAS